jgi:hypothetical protein
MKLKDYFKAQNNYHIDTTQKFLMYEKIISKQNKYNQSPVKKFFSVKSFAYWFMSMLILVWVYGLFFVQDNISYEDFIVQNQNNIANAWYIAKVVEFNGNFYVSHGDKIYKTNKIADGDVVVLKKWSEVIFDINSGTQTKLVWPARFTLSQNDSGVYQLAIAEWDYIQIESSTWESMEITLWDDITISSSENLDLLITKSDNEYKINNQWNQVKVTTNNKTKQLESKQLLAIKDNDIRLIENAEDFKVAFTQQSISQTFEIKEETQKTPENTQKTTDALIQEITDKKVDHTLSNDQKQVAEELGIWDKLKIPTQDQTKQLYNNLDKTSLLWTLESLYKDQILWDTKDYNFYLNNIYTKIQNLYKTFDIKLSKTNIVSDIQTLRTSLSESYHIPTSQLNNLSTLANWITYIQSQPASVTDHEQADQARTNLINNLPSNLIFN